MNTKLVAATIASLLISPLAMSQDAPSYSFIEAGYTSYDVDPFDTTGFRVKGGLEIGDLFFITADYSDTSGEIDGFDIDFGIDFDLVASGYGAGMKFDLANGGSWYVSYSLNSWEIGDGEVDLDTTRIGYRQKISDSLEMSTSVTDNKVETGESDSGYQFGLVYGVNDTFKITADYETIDEIKIISVGARIAF